VFCCVTKLQLIQKLTTSRRLVLDSLKNVNKQITDPSLATAKLSHISQLLDRLHFVTQYNYTLLRDQLGHVSSTRISSVLVICLINAAVRR